MRQVAYDDKLVAGIFTLDFILPGQMTSQGSERSGCVRLALAVLERAIDDVRGKFSNFRGEARTFADNAREWLFSDDRTDAYSAVNLCESLGMSIDAIRREILEWERLGTATTLVHAAPSGEVSRKHWAREVRAVREAHGLSPCELARKLGIVRQAVREWEAGIHTPSERYRDKFRKMRAAARDRMGAVETATA